jgi:hypothetical protein
MLLTDGVDQVVDFGESETPVLGGLLHVEARVDIPLQLQLAHDIAHTGDIQLREVALDGGEEFSLALHASYYTHFQGSATTDPMFFKLT